MSEIRTMRDAEREIQALIDSFSNEIFLEALEVMIDSAQVAKDARKEELGDDGE